MQGTAELVQRAHALRDALAEAIGPEKGQERALNLVVVELAREVARRSCCTVPFEPLARSDSAFADSLLSNGAADCWHRAYDDWRRTLSAESWYGELERLAARQGAVEDRAYYAVEWLLAEYSANLRRKRGIYYTPRPIVDYLLASVDRLLAEQLDVTGGLAALGAPDDDSVALVDPACGAGIFLACALRRAVSSSVSRLEASSRERALQRVAGFEVVAAAAEAARWLLKAELTPGDFHEDPHDVDSISIWNTSALEESSCAKLDALRPPGRPLVIVGNPPYANFGRANRSSWIRELLRDYQVGLSERKHNLHDDAVKFLRWSQWQIDCAGRGVLALVLNHAFLDGLTHCRLRESLLGSFQQLYLLDLHGSVLRPARGAAATHDENVFGVRPGIVLLIGVKDGTGGPCEVRHAELIGSREDKLQAIASRDVASTPWKSVRPQAPDWRCVPHSAATSSTARYQEWPRIIDIFEHYTSGVQTKNDALYTDFVQATLSNRIQRLLAERGGLSVIEPHRLVPYMVAPWDTRWIYYDPQLLGRARHALLKHMLQENVGLVFMRQNTNAVYDHVLATRTLVSDRVFHSGHGAPFVAPLFVYDGEQPTPNLQRSIVERLSEHIGDTQAQDVFAYIYAVLQSAIYRTRHSELLNRDFPRIPIPREAELFRMLAALGRQLVAWHTLPILPPLISTSDSDSWQITPRYPRWNPREEAVYVNSHDFFPGISRAVWEMRRGGCAVLQRWLTQRRGRTLAPSERAYFAALAERLCDTLRIEEQLDEAVQVIIAERDTNQ